MLKNDLKSDNLTFVYKVKFGDKLITVFLDIVFGIPFLLILILISFRFYFFIIESKSTDIFSFLFFSLLFLFLMLIMSLIGIEYLYTNQQDRIVVSINKEKDILYYKVSNIFGFKIQENLTHLSKIKYFYHFNYGISGINGFQTIKIMFNDGKTMDITTEINPLFFYKFYKEIKNKNEEDTDTIITQIKYFFSKVKK